MPWQHPVTDIYKSALCISGCCTKCSVVVWCWLLLLQAAGLVDAVDLSNVDRLSMACPALPLCGLAITEAERGLPDINRWA